MSSRGQKQRFSTATTTLARSQFGLSIYDFAGVVGGSGREWYKVGQPNDRR